MRHSSIAWIAVSLTSVACVARLAPKETTIDVPSQPAVEHPIAQTNEAPDPVITFEAHDDDDKVHLLPASWLEPTREHVPYARAIAGARDVKARFEAASIAFAVTADGGAPDATIFERANAALEQASRRYASAHHAPDATPADRVESSEEAASMVLRWAMRLDEVGLGHVPAGYRSNAAVALTFEDVANGPAKRWRSEGLALLLLCVETAQVHDVRSRPSDICKNVKREFARVQPHTDGGATGCACDPGDPLCSASIGGWCRR